MYSTILRSHLKTLGVLLETNPTQTSLHDFLFLLWKPKHTKLTLVTILCRVHSIHLSSLHDMLQDKEVKKQRNLNKYVTFLDYQYLVVDFFSTIDLKCLCILNKYILSTRNCVDIIFTCWPKKYKFILQKLSILTFSRRCKGQMKVICQKTNQNFIIVLFHCSCITKMNKWSENDLSKPKVNITWDQIRTWSEKSILLEV